MILQTKRLILRELSDEDVDALHRMMGDLEVMQAAYERVFSKEEVKAWISRHLKRYETLGFGLWAVVLKETGEVIGQCGLTYQSWNHQQVLEIGYLFQKQHWHQGYASEAAKACKQYAFSVLNASSVYSIIRDTHIASQKVAIRNGMRVVDCCIKTFQGIEMNFQLFETKNQYQYITLRERPDLKEEAASWFSNQWGISKSAYLECMNAYLDLKTELGWYLCLDKDEIVGGLGVIENDFHERLDLTPNICAVYTKKEYRGQGIAGCLLYKAVNDLKNYDINPVYLITDHIGFYEKYGWEFLCLVQGDDQKEKTRMYVFKDVKKR